MNRKATWKLTLITTALLAGSSVVVLAGPPLVCHRLDIGNAKSLPWGANPVHWDQPLQNYNLANLVDQTLTLLSRDTPVIVRMETIRRAVIYAHRSPEISKELVLILRDRAHSAERRSKAGALSWFDYGYLIETMKEASWAYHETGEVTRYPNVAMNLDGYPWVTRALAASGNNRQIQFALALMVLGRRDLNSHHEYAQAALIGAKTDSLLARNLTTFFRTDAR
jgi:hypothetical protein